MQIVQIIFLTLGVIFCIQSIWEGDKVGTWLAGLTAFFAAVALAAT